MGQDPGDEIEVNKKHFAKKLTATIPKTSEILDSDREFEAEYIELLVENRTKDILQNSQNYEGYYYPVRLSNTYGLLIDCSLKDETFPHPVKCLESLKKIIDDQLNNEEATLGQTWIIYGQLPDKGVYPAQTAEDVARECYQALIAGAHWESNLQGTGDFVGGTIFELWSYRLNISEGASTNTLPKSTLKDNHHVIPNAVIIGYI